MIEQQYTNIISKMMTGVRPLSKLIEDNSEAITTVDSIESFWKLKSNLEDFVKELNQIYTPVTGAEDLFKISKLEYRQTDNLASTDAIVDVTDEDIQLFDAEADAELIRFEKGQDEKIEQLELEKETLETKVSSLEQELAQSQGDASSDKETEKFKITTMGLYFLLKHPDHVSEEQYDFILDNMASLAGDILEYDLMKQFIDSMIKSMPEKEDGIEINVNIDSDDIVDNVDKRPPLADQYGVHYHTNNSGLMSDIEDDMSVEDIDDIEDGDMDYDTGYNEY